MSVKIPKEAGRFIASSLLLFVILASAMYKTPLASLALISLKLSFFVHLPGYLVALRVFKEEYDPTALLFIGFGLGLVLNSLLAYFVGTVGLSVTKYAYAMPLGLLAFSALLHIKKQKAGE